MATKTLVLTITCPLCSKEFFSRAPHDYVLCGCPNNTMIDGGFSYYYRLGGKRIDEIRKSLRKRFVKASKQELYKDWNTRTDAFGTIAKKGVK